MDVKAIIKEQSEIIAHNKYIYPAYLQLNEKSPSTVSHCVNVAHISVLIGKELGLNETKLSHLAMAALLHDIGKVKMPDKLLSPTRTYTEEDFNCMKQHPSLGADLLKRIPRKIKRAVLEHHENFNGTGYPYKKERREISLYGKILRVADVIDALHSKREYKKAMSMEEVSAYLNKEKGLLFDPSIVEACNRILPQIRPD